MVLDYEMKRNKEKEQSGWRIFFAQFRPQLSLKPLFVQIGRSLVGFHSTLGNTIIFHVPS